MAHPYPRRLPVRLATAAVAGVLLLGACSGEGDDASKSSEGPSSSAKSPDAVQTLIDTGLNQIQDGDQAAARGTFTSVLALDDDNVYAHYNLGYLAQLDQDAATAKEQYDLALTADPAFAPALYNLGILTEADDLEAAVALYQRGVEADPEDAATHMRLGFALQELGETDEGQKMLDQGIELDPGMAQVKAPAYGS